MKSFESDIKRIAEKTRLKAREREEIRERILSYMEYHPLKKAHVKVDVRSRFEQGDTFYLSWSSLTVRVTSGVLALILIVGVPLLAERAVPGDMLYLIKTGVNEGIQTQLATSPYEKVELETKLIERRISEARLLAQEGKLTSEVEAEIAKTVKGHADAVQSGIAELRVHDADGAAIAEIVFNSALEVQSAVLGGSDTKSSSSVVAILDAVNTARGESASDGYQSTPSYGGLTARIELETTRSYELFESIKDGATENEIVDIERRLADISRSIIAAKELKELDEAGAVAEMMNVLGLIQKLISFMTDIDVRETVLLETLVPVVLTLEERTGIVESRIAEVETKLETFDERVASSTEAAVREKLMTGRDRAASLVASTSEALGMGGIELGETYSLEALVIANDLLAMTGGDGVEPKEETLVPTVTEVTPLETVETSGASTTLEIVTTENETAAGVTSDSASPLSE